VYEVTRTPLRPGRTIGYATGLSPSWTIAAGTTA